MPALTLRRRSRSHVQMCLCRRAAAQRFPALTGVQALVNDRGGVGRSDGARMLTNFVRGICVVGMAILLLGTSTVAVASAEPIRAELSGAARQAAGAFTAEVDFSSLVARDVRGNKCEFTVNGTLNFTGTLEGSAPGTTRAVIFAPCSAATTSPPGTFFDVFAFRGTFTGTVHGAPVSGDLTYAGITRAGGAIDAKIILAGDRAKAVLRADAVVALGGTYRGHAKAV